MAEKPKTKLERLGRDLNRTFLHGSRPETTAGVFRPATVVSGQQIPVDVPEQGGLRFEFAIGETSVPVPITRANVLHSVDVMRRVVAQSATYLKLENDLQIPVWVYHPREFTLPERPVAEDVLRRVNPNQTILRLPQQVIQEVERVGGACDVSLWRLQEGQKGQVLPPKWRPAILLRFPLERVAGTSSLSGDDQVLEIRGVSQGDRAFLDRLHLLAGDPETPSAQMDGISLHLQEGQADPQPVRDWTIARINLTLEARPAAAFTGLGPPAALPHVATEAEPEDGLRLLQMASITNSGGYFLRVASTQKPDTLVVCVFLKGGTATHKDSVQVPAAANAIAYPENVSPNVARFEDQRSIRVTPFVPPGFVSFGWTRTEPAEKSNDDDRYGFGTISLVDYRVLNKSGVVLQPRESRTAISPLQSLPVIPEDPEKTGLTSETTGSAASVAMQLVATHEPTATGETAALTPPASVRYYRASHPCYNPSTESPYAALADPLRREVSIIPGFRDVFGNTFTPESGADQKKALFYTDALMTPSEWPGVEFAIRPITDGGRPSIDLIAAYRPAEDPNSEKARRTVLELVRRQIEGAPGDVKVELLAAPLLNAPKQITDKVREWIEAILNGVTVNLVIRCACDAMALTAPAEFEPIVRIVRADSSLLPQESNLPKDTVLRQTIEAQIKEATSRVKLIDQAALVGGGNGDTAREEFRQVAKAFHTHLSSRYGIQVGFARDEVNQHHLWLFPNSLFPAAATAAPDWSFATARPLSSRLGSDELEVPVFTRPETNDRNWLGFALNIEHFVEQDADSLAKAALSLIEREAFRPELLTDRGTLAFARQALQVKERIAKRLAESDDTGSPSYVVPLFADPGVLDGGALKRLATDAFLKNLEGFYSIDTFVQLPLTRGVDPSFVAMLEGKVKSPFVSQAGARLPSFSDVLLKHGEQRVTVLYDVPAGVSDPNTAVPPVPSGPGVMQIDFTHLQMHPRTGVSDGILNRGTWLELAEPVTLAWPGIGRAIPAAIRSFPAKPVLESVAATPPVLPGTALRKTDVPLFTRWGWSIVCAAEGLSTDTIHAEVRYNEPESPSEKFVDAFQPEWAPASLLHCLIVLKRLSDNWASIAVNRRLEIVAKLMAFLAGFLDSADAATGFADDRRRDLFDLTFPNPSQPPVLRKVEFQVMDRIAVVPPPSGPDTSGLRRFAIQAAPNDNKASLIARTGSGGPVRNLRPSLRLVRNEAIADTPLDMRLVYECATVEAPRERLVANTWPDTQLTFRAEAGETFSSTLESFFTALFAEADFATLDVEVGAALVCHRQNLRMTTPYSIVPMDLMPGSASAVAATVSNKTLALLGSDGSGQKNPARPPDMDEAAIRLRVKVSPKGGNVERTLVEIAAIDFPLA